MHFPRSVFSDAWDQDPEAKRLGARDAASENAERADDARLQDAQRKALNGKRRPLAVGLILVLLVAAGLLVARELQQDAASPWVLGAPGSGAAPPQATAARPLDRAPTPNTETAAPPAQALEPDGAPPARHAVAKPLPPGPSTLPALAPQPVARAAPPPVKPAKPKLLPQAQPTEPLNQVARLALPTESVVVPPSPMLAPASAPATLPELQPLPALAPPSAPPASAPEGL